MPKHKSNATRGGLESTDFKGRILKALKEGRTQQALELAKQLHKQQPTPEHAALVRQAYLARGKDLRQRGSDKDALTVLRAALAVVEGDQDWVAQIAVQLAACGGISEALEMLPRVEDTAIQARVLGATADRVLAQAGVGVELLPEAVRADYARIVKAFAESEAGRVEAVQENLAGIGLRSPFLEWKLLLRGLEAYYGKDDARALENWQRLDAERLPARMAAPFRQAIDPVFRSAQSGETQSRLRSQFDRVQGSGMESQLRPLRAALAKRDDLNPAFRLAEVLMPTLRRDVPAIADRLANVFYWAILNTGPQDIPRYQRIFGKPASDPNLHRLQALAGDEHDNAKLAHEYWQKYERDLAANPSLFPAGQADRARALIWGHLGQIATAAEMADSFDDLPPFRGTKADFSPKLKPTPPECFRRSIELAPDSLESYLLLYTYYVMQKSTESAIAAGQRLLEKFPDNLPTLESLALMYTALDEPEKALPLYQRALACNPIDRRLRELTCSCHLHFARHLAVAKDYEQARSQIAAAAVLQTEETEEILLARAAAIEFKAGNTVKGEEYLQKAYERSDSRLVVLYHMITEVARLKLHKTYKTRFEGEFNAAFTEVPDGASLAGMVKIAATLTTVKYTGQKAHQKLVATYVERSRKIAFTESQLETVCKGLIPLKFIRPADHFFRRGAREFPKNPYFPYLAASSILAWKKPESIVVWKVKDLLDRAQALAQKLPKDARIEELLGRIERSKEKLTAINPIAMRGIEFAFSSMFGTRFEEGMFDDEDDDLNNED